MWVHKKVFIDGVEYEKYHIKRLEWDLESLIVGVMVLYYDEQNKEAVKIKTHYFNMGEEVDVNKLIDEIQILHNGKV